MTNVVVDDSHHVTSFHLADGNANIDAINQDQDIETWNWQTGAKFERGNLKVDFMYGDSGATFAAHAASLRRELHLRRRRRTHHAFGSLEL